MRKRERETKTKTKKLFINLFITDRNIFFKYFINNLLKAKEKKRRKKKNLIKYQNAFHIDFQYIYVDINMRFYFHEQHMYHH